MTRMSPPTPAPTATPTPTPTETAHDLTTGGSAAPARVASPHPRGVRAERGPTAAEGAVRAVLAQAGITIDGPNPWDPQVLDPRFFDRVASEGSLGAGESYMDGWWECDALDEFAARVLRAGATAGLRRSPALLWAVLRTRVLNMQGGRGRRRAMAVAKTHYDLGNEFFAAMLGPSMTYSCGYWAAADALDEAQYAKLDLVCRKLGLRPGHRVLDIGCGWGSFAHYAATRYGCAVTGVTLSAPQAEYARRSCAGLPVDVRVLDYRSPEVTAAGRFDRVVSLGMLEHVGHKNLPVFMTVARRALTDDGMLLVQSIARTVDTRLDLWIDRYIFPNSYLPTVADVGWAAHGRFIMEDWHNFGADYDRTLVAWCRNFERHATRAEPGKDAPAQGERFRRMWRYYLLTFAGCFRARSRVQLWQIVFSPHGVPGGYRSVR